MSTKTPDKSGGMTTVADRVVVGPDGDRPINALVAALREDPAVESAEIRVEHPGGAVPDGDVFETAGDRSLREYGEYSVRVSFGHRALTFSGFEVDEPVSVYARENAILVMSNRDDAVPRLREVVAVELDVANVPASVSDTLDVHDARMLPQSVEVAADGTLSFVVAVPTGFAFVDDRQLRRFGNSTVLTIPPGALDAAGLGAGDEVNVRATDGVVLFVGQ